MSPNAVCHGSRLTLSFTLSIAGGLVVDSADENEPLTIVMGQGDIAPGLEKYLIGLAPGEHRRFDIPAGEVYGPADPDALYTFARTDFPPELQLEPGQVIGFTLPSGEEVPALIMAVEEGGVQVDLSHPLAGHDLIFEVDILALESA